MINNSVVYNAMGQMSIALAVLRTLRAKGWLEESPDSSEDFPKGGLDFLEDAIKDAYSVLESADVEERDRIVNARMDDAGLFKEVDAFIREGKPTQAIKLWRNVTGCTLRDAKRAIDLRIAERFDA